LLPARPNQEVGIGHARKLHSVRQHLLINVIKLNISIDGPASHFSSCLNNIPPATVSNCDNQVQSVIACRMCFSRFDFANKPGIQTSAIAYEFESHIIAMQFGDFSLQRLHK